MDYRHLISQAFQITIKNKFLWLFGIIGAIFGASPQFFNFPPSFDFNFSGMESVDSPSEFMGKLGFIEHVRPEDWFLLIILGVLIFSAIILVSVYFQIWSYVALVSQTLNIARGKEGSFKEGKMIGERLFWKVLGLRLLIGLVGLPAILLLAIPPLMFFVAGINSLAIVFLIIDGMIFFIGIFIYAVVASIVTEFSVRILVEKNFGVVDSILSGLHLFRNHLGESLLAWVISMALDFVTAILIIFVFIFFFIFGLVSFLINPWLVAVPIIVFLGVLAVIGGVWTVFLVSYWSLAYSYLLNKDG